MAHVSPPHSPPPQTVLHDPSVQHCRLVFGHPFTEQFPLEELLLELEELLPHVVWHVPSEQHVSPASQSDVVLQFPPPPHVVWHVPSEQHVSPAPQSDVVTQLPVSSHPSAQQIPPSGQYPSIVPAPPAQLTPVSQQNPVHVCVLHGVQLPVVRSQHPPTPQSISSVHPGTDELEHGMHSFVSGSQQNPSASQSESVEHPPTMSARKGGILFTPASFLVMLIITETATINSMNAPKTTVGLPMANPFRFLRKRRNAAKTAPARAMTPIAAGPVSGGAAA